MQAGQSIAGGAIAGVRALQRETESRLASADAALVAAAEQALRARREGIGVYLSEARFAVARLNDPSQRAFERGVQRVATGVEP